MIGKKLYKYISFRGIGEYEIIGQDNDFILAKSLFCNNKNNPCIIKLNKEDGYKNRWKYVSMMQYCGSDTYEDRDGNEVHNEYIWHYDSPYFENKADCKKHEGNKILKSKKEKIENLEKQLKSAKESFEEIEKWMNNEVVNACKK